MNDLTILLRKNLANALVYSIQAQSHHWNVRGMLFTQLHDFFGEIYSAAYDMIDPLAEYIRIEGALAPASIADIWKDKSVNELNYVPGTTREMLENLLLVNTAAKASLQELMDAAEQNKRAGLADWVSAQIDALAKFDWKLKAHLEG